MVWDKFIVLHFVFKQILIFPPNFIKRELIIRIFLKMVCLKIQDIDDYDDKCIRVLESI
jgi:hypothetical protein